MSPIPNLDALDANEQGRLTLAQAIGLIPMIVIGAILFLVGAFISGGIIYGLISHTFKGSLLAAVIVGGSTSLALFWVAYMVGGTRLIDIVLGQVRHIDGQGVRYTGRGSRGGGVIYYYGVGKQDFQIISGKTWRALPESVMVRGYYTPLSKSLVNVKHFYSKST
ncbi:MAG: hypothetical protein ABI904_13990 [Chloroflexota bacterium]